MGWDVSSFLAWGFVSVLSFVVFYLAAQCYQLYVNSRVFIPQGIPVLYQILPKAPMLILRLMGWTRTFPRLGELLIPASYERPHVSRRIFERHAALRKQLEKEGKPANAFLGRAFVVVMPYGSTVFVRDPHLLAQVFNARSVVGKPVEDYRSLTFWGENVLGSDGYAWKKHRIVANSAFNEFTFQNVFEHSRNGCNSSQQKWMEKSKSTDGLELDANEWTSHLALYVFCKAAMSMDLHSNERSNFRTMQSGREMHMRDVMHDVAENIFKFAVLKMLPAAVQSLLKKYMGFDHVVEVYAVFEEELKRLSARDMSKENHLLAKLVKGAEKQDKVAEEKKQMDDGLTYFDKELEDERNQLSTKLTTGELHSNVFIFMVAGHETSAHSMSFAMNMLSYQPEVQQFIYDEVSSLLGSSSFASLTYQQLFQLPSVWAAIYETLRMFNPVPAVPKLAHENFTLKFHDEKSGVDSTLLVPAKSRVEVTIACVHYSEESYPEPNKWQIARWYKNEFRDSAGQIAPSAKNKQTSECLLSLSAKWCEFMPFSQSSRQCIGSRFALVEMVTVLAFLVYHYQLLPISPKMNLERAKTTVTMAPPESIVQLIARQRKE